MSKNDPKTPATEPTEAPAVKAAPQGLHVYRALLALDQAPGNQLRPRQAAILALYAGSLPDLMADALTPAEIRGWAARFRTTNPHAWHASMNGDVIRFLLVIGEVPTERASAYQTGCSELVSSAAA